MRTAVWAGLAGVVALVVGSGVGAMAVVALRLDLWFDERKRPEDVVMVVVAARDLAAGHVITNEDLYAVQMPPRYVPEHADLDLPGTVGRGLTEDVLKDEFLREERLR